MELTKIGEALGRQRRGTYISLLMQRVIPTPKKSGHVVLKITKTVVRIGVGYGNIKSVKDAGIIPGSLPGDETWLAVKGVKAYPFIIDGKNGFKIRFTKTMRQQFKAVVTYVLDGRPVSKKELEGIVAPSYLESHANDSPIFDVKAENILKIGKEVV